MANKTHIRTIENKTEDTIVLENGEDGNKRIEIKGFNDWSGDLVVPWIGRQDEAWKALKVYITGGHDKVWIFQDYWYPAGKDAIKYCVGTFSYKDAKEISGNNQGGGDKRLLVDVNELVINLEIV